MVSGAGPSTSSVTPHRILAFPKQLNILDLPDEILVKICEDVRGSQYHDNYSDAISDVGEVKNLRLICQHLSAVSSHLLIQRVTLQRNSIPDLSRLEAISHHPVFSKSVRAVRLMVDHYDGSMARHFDEFADRQANILDSTIQDTDRKLWSRANNDIDSFKVFGISHKAAREQIEKARRIEKLWYNAADIERNPEGFDPGQVEYLDMLDQAHREYNRLFEEQDRLGGNEASLRSIAAAIRRMPLARTLEYDDDSRLTHKGGERRFELFKVLESREAMMQALLTPFRWEKIRPNGPGQLPTGMLVLLPIFIHDHDHNGNEASLTSLRINISAPRYAGVWTKDQYYLHNLTYALQKLKFFSFRLHAENGRGFEKSGEINIWKGFLDAMLRSEFIEELDLDFDVCGANAQFLGNEEPNSLGSLLCHRAWPNLRRCHLEGMSFHARELEEFLEGRKTSILDIKLKSMNLLCGTWVQVVDVLRKHGPYRRISISLPRGAEIETIPSLKLHALFPDTSVWARTSQAMNELEKYIHGVMDDNPLRESAAGILGTASI